MMFALRMPGQLRSTRRCASRNSSSRPGFTLNRTALNAVMMALPRVRTAGGLADQDGDEQKAGQESRSEQFEVAADGRTFEHRRSKLANLPATEQARVRSEGRAGELHGKSLTRFLPCSNSAYAHAA